MLPQLPSGNVQKLVGKTIEAYQAQTGGAEIALCLTHVSIALSSWRDILPIPANFVAKLAPRRLCKSCDAFRTSPSDRR
jgi:hypothetical protein